MALFKEAKAACQSDSSYCADVPLYRKDAVRECGLTAVAKAEGGKPSDGGAGDNPSPQQAEGPSEENNKGITALTEEMPDPEKELPRSCAYFTKPAYQPIRLNYHQLGAMLCYNGWTYVCEGDGGGKEWVKRADCGFYGRELQQACKLEGTCK